MLMDSVEATLAGKSLPKRQLMKDEAFDQDEERTDDLFQATFDYLKDHPSCTDEELAQHLQLKRPASARFWRLKVKELLAESAM